jgi:hypothetical protein
MNQSFVKRIADKFMGRGAAAVTVPPLDGGLTPNNILEDLPAGIKANAPDDIVLWNGTPLWSDGTQLVSSEGVQAKLGSEITALAVSGDQIALATLADGLLVLGPDLKPLAIDWNSPVKNVTALAFDAEGGIWFCTGSEVCAPDEWRRDLMEMNRTGLVGRADPATGDVRVVKRKLGYPSGIAVMPNGSIVFSEAWASHLVEMVPDRITLRIVLDEIPGYPGRIHLRPDGGYWLCIFAPRSPLIEFVLREPAYRKAMLAEVSPECWVAPDYSSGKSFNEPMQGGALKQMGILKPWAPTRSYGLVAQLNEDFILVSSFHSRAGGRRHGITSATEAAGKLWLTGRGAGEVLVMDVETEGKSL